MESKSVYHIHRKQTGYDHLSLKSVYTTLFESFTLPEKVQTSIKMTTLILLLK